MAALDHTEPVRPGGLRRDTVFDLLSNDRRIMAVEFVDAQGPTTCRELAEELAAEENGIEAAAVGSDEYKRVYVALYQIHLPKLDGHGVIDYDQARGDVAPGPNLDDCLDYLTDDEPSGRWLSRTLRRLGL